VELLDNIFFGSDTNGVESVTTPASPSGDRRIAADSTAGLASQHAQ
jgi:hypothetical protein